MIEDEPIQPAECGECQVDRLLPKRHVAHIPDNYLGLAGILFFELVKWLMASGDQDNIAGLRRS
jgi:hypothetical protein